MRAKFARSSPFFFCFSTSTIFFSFLLVFLSLSLYLIQNSMFGSEVIVSKMGKIFTVCHGLPGLTSLSKDLSSLINISIFWTHSSFCASNTKETDSF